MRFKLVLNILSRNKILPINYQYALHSWIYKVIGRANAEFARFLHDEGYALGSKQFKLFTFSSLQGTPYEIFPQEGRILFKTDELSLKISFWMPQAAKHFIVGLFQRQQFSIGDRLHQVDFQVSRIEALPRPFFTDRMQYRLLTPVVLSNKVEGNRHKQYLDPASVPDYGRYFINNLLEKARAVKLSIREPIGVVDYQDELAGEFRLIGKSKRKGIHIKQHQAGHTQVIGYLYNFELEAPVELQELGYYGGFGEENGMGFGMGMVNDEG